MKLIPKLLFLVLISVVLLANPASATDFNTQSVTIQTALIPVELYIVSIGITIGLICFAITRKDHSAIWISVLSVLSGAFCLGCSFSYGRTITTVMNETATTAITAVTNVGCTLFSVGLLVFAVIILVSAIFTTWQDESKQVM